LNTDGAAHFTKLLDAVLGAPSAVDAQAHASATDLGG
jgi:hypothetical protein